MKTPTKKLNGDVTGLVEASIEMVKKSSKTSLKKHDNTQKIKNRGKEEYLEIPQGAFSLLKQMLAFMAEGKSISIIPTETELSTQQAARLLNVSRPHVVKLLEDGEIPFKKTGSHRRILLKDLDQYEKKLAKKREKQLAFLTKQAQELGLGY